MSIQFAHPEFLWFLLLLLLPIIIHLFNFKRYKQIYFSNLQFLQRLDSENRRKSKLEKLLLLLLRLLALTSIIIAFSQPYLQKSGQHTASFDKINDVDIYIDNSFSMNGRTEQGNALEVAKNKAFDLIKALPEHSRFRIYTSDIKHYTRYLNKTQAIARVQNINISPESIKLSELLKNIKIDQGNQIGKIYLISDFQKQQFDFDNLQADSTLQLNLIHLQQQENRNLSLDTCWLKQSNQSDERSKEILVKISNHSDQDLKNLPIELLIDPEIKTNANFDIQANANQTVSLRFSADTSDISGRIQIHDYPVNYDNRLYFSLQNVTNFHVLAINQDNTNEYISKLYESEKAFQLKNISKSTANNQNFSQYQLLILNKIEQMESGLAQNLKDYLKLGGNLLFIPANRIHSTIHNFLQDISAPKILEIDSTKQRIGSIATQSKLYQNVFQKMKKDVRLPDVFRHYHLKDSKNTTQEDLWKTSGGEALFTKTKFQRGNFFLLSMQLNPQWTNLINHPLFIPSLINLSKSDEIGDALYYEIGKNNSIRINTPNSTKEEDQFHIQNRELHVDIIPRKVKLSDREVKLYTYNQIRKAGNFHITLKDSFLKNSSFNYSRQESDFRFYTMSEIESKISQYFKAYRINSAEKMKPSAIYHEQREGKQLWKKFILLCFAFLVLEALLRREKN